MKLNPDGKMLIGFLSAEYDPPETKTNAEKAIRLYVYIPLTDNQFSALVPLVMYIGIPTFRKSKLLKLLNSATPAMAAEEFGSHIYAYDEHGCRFADQFLVKQRDLERLLFLTPEVVKKRVK